MEPLIDCCAGSAKGSAKMKKAIRLRESQK
jgi:hypothetical protein